jgi:isopenicillin N synthase-like dioxygenase
MSIDAKNYLKSVPELSLASYTDGDVKDQKKFIDDLFKGLKQFGFIILKDHPIQVDLLNKAYSLSEQLFSMPEEKKLKYVSPNGGGQRGYTPFGKEHAKNQSVPDLKEFWHVGRELPAGHKYANSYPQNIWAHELADFKKTFLDMYEALDIVASILLKSLTGPLKLEENYFDRMIEDGNSILRLLHYPPIPEGVDPRCVRAAAHEDINLITILVAASASGLELLTREGEWLPVETDANNLIVDSGDMLSRITNEVIPSTTHRVVNPKGENKSRYSMPYFIHPNPEAVLTCLDSCRGEGAKYPDILAQDFLMQRLREIGLTK